MDKHINIANTVCVCVSMCVKDKQKTFKPSGKFCSKQGHRQLASVVRFTASPVTPFHVEVGKVDICFVVTDADGVDNTTWRT